MSVAVPQASLRERKKTRTRDALIQAAMQLFEAKGYEGTTVDEIAASADVSRRTFFRYFESKESIVFPRFRGQIAQFRETAAARLQGETGLAAVRRGCVEMGAEMMRNRLEIGRFNKVVQRSSVLLARERLVDLEWEAAFTEVLQRDLDDDEARRRAKYVAAALIGVIRVAFREWHAGDEADDLVEIGSEALDLVIEGMHHALD